MKKTISKLTNSQKIEVLFNVLRYIRKVELDVEILPLDDTSPIGVCGLIKSKTILLLKDIGVSNSKVINKATEEFVLDYLNGDSKRNGASVATWFTNKKEDISVREWYSPRIKYIWYWIRDLAIAVRDSNESTKSGIECSTVKCIHPECINVENVHPDECTKLEKLCILDRIITQILYDIEISTNVYGSAAILYLRGLCIHLDSEGNTVLVNKEEKPNVELCRVKILNLISEFKAVYKSWYTDRSDSDLHYYTFNVGTSSSKVRGWFGDSNDESILSTTWYEPRLLFLCKWIDFIIEGGKIEYERFLR
jgi:hypothetical protein